MALWQKILWLGLAGAGGTLCRFAMSKLVQQWAGIGFPWGTVSINITGCFLFGLVWALAGERAVIGSEARLIVLTGFMGAFTTFSTFVFESGQLLADREWLPALANISLQNVAGIGLFFAGLILGRCL